MPGISSTGQCDLCDRTFSKAAISRHIASCVKLTMNGESTQFGKRRRTPYLHIALEGEYAPAYWLRMGVPAECTLADLDSVLRQIWLECCGHLSSFNIAGVRYIETSWAGIDSIEEAEHMDRPIGKVLRAGDNFEHEYDFGSTTHLKCRVLADLPPVFPKRNIHLLARNHAPEISCAACGRPATQLCNECACSGEDALCDKCAKGHKCGEEMLLPVVNSPRMGVCGYCGPSQEP